MFGFKKNEEAEKATNLDQVLESLTRNEISITTHESESDGIITRSKFGGKPAVPSEFEWPRFEAEDYDEETANRPLSFLCQINLNEIAPFDKEALLPPKGLLLFFYEQAAPRWGFDPKDRGCSRVFFFEDVSHVELMDYPDDLNDAYRVKEYDISFCTSNSYPSYEEFSCYSNVACDWDKYDENLEKANYKIDSERHKLLGYANLIQNEMLTECERIERGLYCGDSKSYKNTPDDIKADINRSATEWILLFQMASIQEDDYELMFGDAGNLYFYIRKEDLRSKQFNKVWLVLQCG